MTELVNHAYYFSFKTLILVIIADISSMFDIKLSFAFCKYMTQIDVNGIV
jgi:hypothetical protein